MLDRKSTKVVVVGGGGTMGSSTALHLVRAGYTPSNITVLDTYEIPSAQSAGNDLNKIMGVRTRSPADIMLSKEALEMWTNDALFKEHFHQTGYVDCASTPGELKKLKGTYEKLRKAGVGSTHHWLGSEDELLGKAPHLCRDKIQGWQGLYSSDGDWLAAAKAINNIGQYLRSQDVNFGFGKAGTFKQPILARDGETCIGVETADGTRYMADKVVLAAGAWSPVLVDLEEQCCSKAWVYAHLQLTPDEAERFKGVPVVYNGDIGFFFEPNEYGVIKVCDEFPGFTRFKQHQPFGASAPKRISVPRSHAKHPTDTYPDQSQLSIERAVKTFLPDFADRPLFNKSMCWCTDTADAALLICEHPKWRNFIVATGDSGHSFKMLPNIGRHIVKLIEGDLDPDLAKAWRWRPGGNALKSQRAAEAQDLADLPGWRGEKGDKAELQETFSGLSVKSHL